MGLKKKPHVIMFLVVLISLPLSVAARQRLDDNRKKAIVYRMYAGYKEEFPGVAEITPKEAMKLLKKHAVVFVDTREASQIEVSRLPNAITEEEFLKNPEKYKDKKIVVYCTIGYLSGLFAREMGKKGVAVFNLKGGILAWVLEGGKVYDKHGETKRLHVYGPKWNYAPNGYDVVIFGFWERFF